MKKINWTHIDTVILDLDGTLIDLYFDHYFWRYHVSQYYAQKCGISPEQSQRQLKQRYDAIEHSINWYDIDFWAKELDLPLRDLLLERGPQVQVREDVYPFLDILQHKGIRRILLTDSHPFTLEVKLKHCDLAPHFDLLLSSHQFGAPKIEQQLWHNLQKVYPFDPAKTVFIDDTEKVLDSALQFGIAYTIGVENPDSSLANKTFSRHISVDNYMKLVSDV